MRVIHRQFSKERLQYFLDKIISNLTAEDNKKYFEHAVVQGNQYNPTSLGNYDNPLRIVHIIL